MFKKIKMSYLINEKEYTYMFEFDDQLLKELDINIDKYDIGYLWYSDNGYEKHGCSFYIYVRDKITKFTTCGFIIGEPSKDKILSKLKEYIVKTDIGSEILLNPEKKHLRNGIMMRIDKRSIKIPQYISE